MGIYDAAKDVANVLKEAGKIKEYQQILELLEDLLNKQKKINDLEEENKVLKEKLTNQEELEFINNAYYKKSTKEGPYCTRCWDKHRNLIRINKIFPNDDFASCPDCNNQVNITGISRPNQFIQRKHVDFR